MFTNVNNYCVKFSSLILFIYNFLENNVINDENRRLILIREFEEASEDTFFSQTTIAALRNCSLSTIERDRWAGIGIPFRKLGRMVRYCKSDIKKWFEEQIVFQSTAQAQETIEKT
jgi:hypothetical protein